MSEHLTFLALGLGSGAVIALLALGVLVTYRASGVINFAHAALGMYLAFVYYEFRQSGDVVLPVLGLPDRLHLIDRPTVGTSIVVCLAMAALVGAAVYLLIFRPLRPAPPLARVVASLGLMAYLIGIVGLRFQGAAATSLRLDGPLPSGLHTVLGVQAPTNRWILALLAVAIGTGLWAMYRLTAFGLATRASAESEEGALLLGLAPTPIGLVNWVLAVIVAAVAIIAAAPIIGLDPAGTSLLIVPALGAALLGRFEAVGLTVASGLAIGMLQSELFNVQRTSDWLPNIGIQQGVPFLVVLLALMWRGSTLPGRGALITGRLPPAVAPTHTIAATAVVTLAGVVALFFLDSQWRLAIIISGIATIIALSIIVLTGLVGQMSLATFALAGTAAFAMIRASESFGLPFPLAPLVGIGVAIVIGTLAGLPAVRVRGLTLAVATLAASIAIEELLFKWSWFAGGAAGQAVPEPSLFGVDLGISGVGDAYPQRPFGILVLVCMFVSMVLVVNLRRRSTGRRWLAVRSNERSAEAASVSAVRAKLTANALASGLAGLAGVLIAYERQAISGSSFAALQSLFAMAIAYLAGIATPIAALLAGVLAAGGLLTVALDALSEGSSKYQFTVNGLLLIVVAVRFPAGIFGAVRSLTRRKVRAPT